jgi:hypothetical protein
MQTSRQIEVNYVHSRHQGSTMEAGSFYTARDAVENCVDWLFCIVPKIGIDAFIRCVMS